MRGKSLHWPVAACLSLGSPALAVSAPGLEGEWVEATQAVPGLVVDLRYATPNNFLGRAVYPANAKCLLRRETAQRLARAAEVLAASGWRLKAYDCYRPLSVQAEMWRLFPRRGYVANPKGGSAHNRGAAVDVTLVDKDGNELEMPTAFDTFNAKAHHGYMGGSEASRRNRQTLLSAMEAAGFKKNRMEWWHYELPNARRFPLADVPFD